MYKTKVIWLRDLEKELGESLFLSFLHNELDMSYNDYLQIYDFYDVLFRISGSNILSYVLYEKGLCVIYDLDEENEKFEKLDVIGVIVDGLKPNYNGWFGFLHEKLMISYGMYYNVEDRFFYRDDLKNKKVAVFAFSKKRFLEYDFNQLKNDIYSNRMLSWTGGINLYDDFTYNNLKKKNNDLYKLYQFYYQGLIETDEHIKQINDRIYKMVKHPKVNLSLLSFWEINKKRKRFVYRFDDYISICLAEDYIENGTYSTQWLCYYNAFLNRDNKTLDWLFKKQECLLELVNKNREYMYGSGYYCLNQTLLNDENFVFSE